MPLSVSIIKKFTSFTPRQEIASLPGVCRWGAEAVLDYLRPVVEAGLSSILLFGVPANLPKVPN